MIKLTLHLWSKIHPINQMDYDLRSKTLRRAPKKSFLIQWIISRSIDAEPTEHWWHYDAWCQHCSNDKVENSSFSFVTVLMIKLTLHLWSKIHPDQSDGLEFEIHDAWKSTKEKLPYSMDHITVDRRQADRTLLTLWCMMSMSKE